MEIIVSIALTAFMYGLVPLCIALFRNDPIQKKTFRLICIGYTVVVALVCAIYAFNQGERETFLPAVLWGTISYNVGASHLKKRGLLPETPEKAKSPTPNMQDTQEGELRNTVEAETNPTVDREKQPISKRLKAFLLAFLTLICLAGACYLGICIGKASVNAASEYADGYDDGYRKGFSNGKQIAYDTEQEIKETDEAIKRGATFTLIERELTSAEKRKMKNVFVSPHDGHYHDVSCGRKGKCVCMTMNYADEFGFVPCVHCKPSV